ncbi:hypothetical protein MPSEU_000117400 [Mayamaea pseudoterrestris]|nr:hypothetical protein MPSEU_000117400 [Mayamaea pseudoterrestris]
MKIGPADPSNDLEPTISLWEELSLLSISRRQAILVRYRFAEVMRELTHVDKMKFPTPDAVCLTDEVEHDFAPVEPPETNAEALSRLRSEVFTLGRFVKTRAIFKFLSDGQKHSQAAMAKAFGLEVDNKKISRPLLMMEDLDILVRIDNDTIMLADVAFPMGRPDGGAGGE